MCRDLGPNWFAAVMGTGIVANAGAVLPVRVPGLRVFATAVWALAAAVLIALTAAWVVHWIRYPERARGHAADPVMAQFWGAPPMALLTVGAGTLLLGRGLIGTGAAVTADWVLWGAGTALGLVTACWIPYLMMTRHDIGPDAAFGGWLMPVVPPMVSAATGALLIPYASPGQGLTLLLACYALFGISPVRLSDHHHPDLVPAGPLPGSAGAPACSQQSNTDQQMSFRNRWSSSTSSRIAYRSCSRCHRHSTRPALWPSPSGAAAHAALIAQAAAPSSCAATCATAAAWRAAYAACRAAPLRSLAAAIAWPALNWALAGTFAVAAVIGSWPAAVWPGAPARSG